MIEPLANTPESGKKFWKPELPGSFVEARYSYPFETMVLRKAVEETGAPTIEGYVLMRIVVKAVRLTPRKQAALGAGYQSVVQVLLLDRATYTQLRVYKEGKSAEAYRSKAETLRRGGSIALGTFQKLKAQGLVLGPEARSLKGIPLRKEGSSGYRRAHGPRSV